MKYYHLERKQIIKDSQEVVWDFFSNPSNLKEITPSYMGFNIISKVPKKIHSNLLIRYKISPVLNIPMTWVTEIKSVKEPNFFVDEQLKGPYKFWHHEHLLKETEEGVEMIDKLTYALPFGWLGRIAHSLFVRKKLNEIFDFRYQKVEQIFNQKTLAPSN